jgi:hypothetical protein
MLHKASLVMLSFDSSMSLKALSSSLLYMLYWSENAVRGTSGWTQSAVAEDNTRNTRTCSNGVCKRTKPMNVDASQLELLDGLCNCQKPTTGKNHGSIHVTTSEY